MRSIDFYFGIKELLYFGVDRDDMLGHLKVLSNCADFFEGVDVPASDAVLFLTPRNSQVDVVHSVGRKMRNADVKKLHRAHQLKTEEKLEKINQIKSISGIGFVEHTKTAYQYIKTPHQYTKTPHQYTKTPHPNPLPQGERELNRARFALSHSCYIGS